MKHGIRYTITIYTNVYYVLAVGNWIQYRTSRELALNADNITETNLTVDNNTTVNVTTKRSESDEFWLLRDDNATEDTTPIPSDDAVTEMSPEETTQPPGPTAVYDDPELLKEYEMNELLFMSRNNCNLELQVNEWEDRKLKIQYETLKSGMSGRCQITLRGKNGILLAVLVSNVQLNGKESRKMGAPSMEVLRLVTKSTHFNYTLREYDGSETYYPLMLTESDRVYLVLAFNGTNPTRARSGYNLEVFNYYKMENNIKPTLQHDEYGYGNSTSDVDNIYITTAVP